MQIWLLPKFNFNLGFFTFCSSTFLSQHNFGGFLFFFNATDDIFEYARALTKFQVNACVYMCVCLRVCERSREVEREGGEREEIKIQEIFISIFCETAANQSRCRNQITISAVTTWYAKKTFMLPIQNFLNWKNVHFSLCDFFKFFKLKKAGLPQASTYS